MEEERKETKAELARAAWVKVDAEKRVTRALEVCSLEERLAEDRARPHHNVN